MESYQYMFDTTQEIRIRQPKIMFNFWRNNVTLAKKRYASYEKKNYGIKNLK